MDHYSLSNTNRARQYTLDWLTYNRVGIQNTGPNSLAAVRGLQHTDHRSQSQGELAAAPDTKGLLAHAVPLRGATLGQAIAQQLCRQQDIRAW